MEKIELKIRFLGDPVLRKEARALLAIGIEERQILSRMAQLMYESSGIGLAAPQVGVSRRMIVADIGSGLYKLINPVIVKRSGKQAMEEGCLSVPGVCIKIPRAQKVTVSALDETGAPVTIEAEGLLATVMQHEIDHLKGKLIVDYASVFDRLRIKRKVAQLVRKSADERMHQSETKSCKLQL